MFGVARSPERDTLRRHEAPMTSNGRQVVIFNSILQWARCEGAVEAFAFSSTLRSTQHLQPANWIRRHEHFYRNRAHQRFISIYTHVSTREQLFGTHPSICINSVVLINFAPNESPKVCSRPGYQFHPMGRNLSQYFLLEGESFVIIWDSDILF